MNELEGAFRRHARAGEHLTELEGVMTQIRQLGEQGVLAELDPDTGDWGPSGAIMNPLKLTAGVLVGEIVHNLRAALDYLVYVLAAADAGAPQSNTQFLIADTPQAFTGGRTRYLKGISDEHVAILRQFQPFKGAAWAGLLRDYDNAGKHREIVSVDVDLNVASILQLSEYLLGGEVDDSGDPIPQGMTMYLKGPVQVLLPERHPVIETLRQIQTQVGLVLMLFAGEFPPG